MRASAIWLSSTSRLPARSAIVRATLIVLKKLRAERFSESLADLMRLAALGLSLINLATLAEERLLLKVS